MNRYRVRTFLNEEYTRLTASLGLNIEDSEEGGVSAAIEIRDCSDLVSLDFDLYDYGDDEDFQKCVRNNLKKAALLKEETRKFHAALKRSYARMAKRRRQKARKKGGRDGGGED